MISQSRPEFATATFDFCRVLFRHKGKILSCFALTLAAAAATVVFWPRSYRSEAKLFIHVGRETVALDPTATTGQVVPVSLSRETEVNSVLEMLRSRVVLEKVVDEIGPDAILHRTAAPPQTPVPSAATASDSYSFFVLDRVSDREKAINVLEKSVTTVGEKKSDVVTVSAKAASPELAQHIVAKFVDAYLGEHARLFRTAGSQAFFVEQAAQGQKKLDDALTRLRDAKNKLGILSVDSQRAIIQSEINEVENRLGQSRASLAAAQGRVAALRKRTNSLPERLATEETNGFANVAADDMRHDLYQLEVREAELASRFTDSFPALVAVREQIKAAKQPLNLEKKPRTQSTTSVNVVHSQLQIGLLGDEANAEALVAEINTLNGQLAQLQERGRSLNEHEAQIVNLEQEVQLCKNNYATYSEKSEQSRIDAALQSERITNVNVVQPADLVTKPVSPNKIAVLALGVLGGLALGIGIAMLIEFFDPSLKTPGEVEERLSLPVMLSIPDVARRHAVLN